MGKNKPTGEIKKTKIYDYIQLRRDNVLDVLGFINKRYKACSALHHITEHEYNYIEIRTPERTFKIGFGDYCVLSRHHNFMDDVKIVDEDVFGVYIKED